MIVASSSANEKFVSLMGIFFEPSSYVILRLKCTVNIKKLPVSPQCSTTRRTERHHGKQIYFRNAHRKQVLLQKKDLQILLGVDYNSKVQSHISLAGDTASGNPFLGDHGCICHEQYIANTMFDSEGDPCAGSFFPGVPTEGIFDQRFNDRSRKIGQSSWRSLLPLVVPPLSGEFYGSEFTG